METTAKISLKGEKIGKLVSKELADTLREFLTSFDLVTVAYETDNVSHSQLEKLIRPEYPITEKNIEALEKLIDRAVKNIDVARDKMVKQRQYLKSLKQ